MVLGLGKGAIVTIGLVIVGVAVASIFVIPYLSKKGVRAK